MGAVAVRCGGDCALQGVRLGTPRTWSLCARACTVWPCSASRTRRAAGTTTGLWCPACWPWPCRLPCKVEAGLEGQAGSGEQALPGLCALREPAAGAAAAALRQPRALRAPLPRDGGGEGQGAVPASSLWPASSSVSLPSGCLQRASTRCWARHCWRKRCWLPWSLSSALPPLT